MIRFITLMILLAPISSFGVSVYLATLQHSHCGYSNGAIATSVQGGVPPYSFLWSNGAITQEIMDLAAGTYTLTVTDGNNDQASLEVTVENLPSGSSILTVLSKAGLHSCKNLCNSGRWITQEGIPVLGTLQAPLTFWPPLETAFEGPPNAYGAVIGLCPGELASIQVDDANGCTVWINEWNFGFDNSSDPTPMSILNIEGSCANNSVGSITVNAGEDLESGLYLDWDLVVLNSAMQVITGAGGMTLHPGSNVVTLSGLPPGEFLLERRFNHNVVAPCVDQLEFTVPNEGPDCGGLTGRVFVDNNLDCIKQFNEPAIPGVILEILPGPYYTTTNASGFYSLTLPTGTYTIQEQSAQVEEHCTEAPIPFTITDPSQTVTVDHPSISLVPLDVSVSMSSGLARPGFVMQYGIQVVNHTPASSGNTTLTMQFDPTLGFLTATPTPSSVSGNTITWNQSSLFGFATRSYSINFQIPPDVSLLGTTLVSTATIATANTDADLANNTATNSRIITGSYDPNDKLAQTISGTNAQYAIGDDEWIDYTIRFQNTGTDTAFNVMITDTLPAILDAATLQIGAASHAFTWQLRSQGTLKFYFPNILLPDSNVNEPKSHGFVSFRIKPVEGIQPGEQIINVANIYFDYNPPVITEPSVLVATVPPIKVAVKAMLGGPFVTGPNTMSDALRVSGALPLTEPYTGLGYVHAGSGGGESTTAGVFAVTGNTAIVDWVVVELRDPSTLQVMHSRSALIRRDGQVVDVDGVSPVSFNAFEGNYRVAIKHRNHLGCMTAGSVALSSTATVVDLTLNSTSTYGTTARQNISGTMVLWPGDVNFDGVVKYTGAGNDRDPVLVAIGGTVPTNVVSGVYSGEDVDMNGNTKYTGTANDRDIILQSVGGVVPTNVRVEQLP